MSLDNKQSYADNNLIYANICHCILKIDKAEKRQWSAQLKEEIAVIYGPVLVW